MGGRIAFISEAGKGTTMTMRWPVGVAEVKEAA